MNDSRRTEHRIKQYLDHLPIPVGREVDDRILGDALATMRQVQPHPALARRPTWRDAMTSRAGRRIAAAIAAGVILFATVHSLTRPAWAFADAIEALREFRAVYMVAAIPGGTADIWIRANEAKTHSTDVVVRTSQGTVLWTRDGSTYQYDPAQNTVHYEDALTIGVAQWIGPELLAKLSAIENARVVRGRDPATGRTRVTLLCSMVDVHGPQSWIIEFDAATKLPVAMKQWSNLDRAGPPNFDAFRIVFYEDLPADVFVPHVPGDAHYVETPLQIADETVDLLGHPEDGILADDMTRAEAAAAAVRVLYQAVIDQDLDRLRRISPLTRTWGDDFLRAIIFRPDQDNRIIEILDIGPISRTGQSRLGPIAVLPVVVRVKNGKRIQEQMVVQFRQPEGGPASVVVHGPYGVSRELPE
jgi:hypothetical protein